MQVFNPVGVNEFERIANVRLGKARLDPHDTFFRFAKAAVPEERLEILCSRREDALVRLNLGALVVLEQKYGVHVLLVFE